jgi:hypothetical protein
LPGETSLFPVPPFSVFPGKVDIEKKSKEERRMCEFIGVNCKVCFLKGKEYEKNKLKSMLFVVQGEGGGKILYYRRKATNFELCKILNHLQHLNDNDKCLLIKILKSVLGLGTETEIEIRKIY